MRGSVIRRDLPDFTDDGPSLHLETIMFQQIKTSFLQWSFEVKTYLGNEVVDLEPHEYCVLATFTIAIGFVLLSGRR